MHTEGAGEALAVTRARAREIQHAETEQLRKEAAADVQPIPIKEPTEDHLDLTESMPGSSFHEDLFTHHPPRIRLSRRQNRATRHQHGLVRAKDKAKHSAANLMPVIPHQELQTMQEQDESLKKVHDPLKSSQPTHPFISRDGLLYRRWTPRSMGTRNTADEVDQLVLPKQCREQVMALAPFGGHLGRKKIFRRISKHFYWPSMHQDIADKCRSCETCQRCRQHHIPRAPMVPLPVVTEPFSRVAMDIVGPLPRSRSGNRYVLVLCDYGTRYPEAVPLRTTDAETIAEELITIFSRVGIPREILTDQGTNFQSQLLRELYRMLHIEALRTTPYHPETDGLVERFNQTLKSMLRKTAAQEGKDWDKLIPFVLFAYREVPQESSPFELLYGRDVRGPLELLKDTWCGTKQRDHNVVSYVLLMRERLDRMCLEVQENMQASQLRQKSRGARECSFQTGDQVLVLLPTTSSKLTAQWQGPYEIIERIGQVNYRVSMHGRRKKQAIFHVNMLQKWHIPGSTAFLTQEEDN